MELNGTPNKAIDGELPDDPCENCTYYEDLPGCKHCTCELHDSWFVFELLQRIGTLEGRLVDIINKAKDELD